MTSRNYYTPKGKLTSDCRRGHLKWQLLNYDPHCAACGRKLTYETAHLVRHFLACHDHVKAVRKRGKHGVDDAICVLTARGRQFLEENRPLILLREAYFADGQEFDSLESAERHAEQLAKLLGVKVEITIGNVNSDRRRRVEIVRPGDDARAGDQTFYRNRRQLVEFATR